MSSIPLKAIKATVNTPQMIKRIYPWGTKKINKMLSWKTS